MAKRKSKRRPKAASNGSRADAGKEAKGRAPSEASASFMLEGIPSEVPIPVKSRSEDGPSPGNISGADAKNKKGSGSTFKTGAIVMLAVLVIALAYYFYTLPTVSFAPGAAVDAATFSQELANSTTVFVVIDLRGAEGDAERSNVMQCGIDFAGSTGIGDKQVIPLSFDTDCTGASGSRPISECAAMLKDGLTLLVRGAPAGASPGATYYSNGMVVLVGSNYTQGTCSIKRV